MGVVGGGGWAVAEDGGGFVVEAGLDLGVMGEEVEGEGEGVGGGLVAGEDDGDALVVELGVGHGVRGGRASLPGGGGVGIGGIGGVEEHGKEVAAVGGIGAALGDHAVDELVEVGAATLEAAHGGNGEALDVAGEGQKGEGEEAHKGVDGLGDGGDVVSSLRTGRDVEVEEALAYNAEG